VVAATCPNRTPRATYAAMITRMDRDIGNMVSLVRELGLEEKTIFIFTSDNGAVYPLSGFDPVFFKSNGDLRGYKHDKGEGLYRRSLYTVWKRTAAPPTMLLFDAPSREVCSVRRGRTNTPLQALALLNEVTFVEAARGLAERMAGAGGDARSRLSLGVRLALARPATDRELDILESGLRDDLRRCRADAKAATSLASAGDKPARPGLDPAEVAAYTLAANVLLNLDEFVTRE